MIPIEPQAPALSEIKDSEIKKEIYYPDLRSTTRLFFVLVLNMVIVAIPTTILLIGLKDVFVKLSLLKPLLFLLQYSATLLITIKYVVRKSKQQQGRFLKLDFNKIQPWIISVIFIGTLALILPLEQASSWVPMPKSVQKFFENSFKKDIFSIITLVIAAPIMEEILCRGIILRGLLKNYSPYKAILISAIFFGAIHLNPWQAVPAFFGGLFIGWIYYKTQSVIPGMIIHATINSTATLFLFLSANQRDLQGLFGIHYYIVAVLVSIVIFVVVCIIINRKVLNIAGSLIKTENTYSFPNKEANN